MLGVLGLMLLSAVLHASWNAIVKHVGRERAATMLTLTFALLFSSALALATSDPWGILNREREPREVLPWLLASGLGEAIYVWSLGHAFSKGDLGVTYALVRSTAMVAVWPLGILAFGEWPGGFALVATVLLIAGIYWVKVEKRTSSPREMKTAKISLGWSIVSGLAVGLYHTGYKGCARAGIPTAWAFTFTLLIAVPLLWAVLGRSLFADVRILMKERWASIALSGVASAGSFLLAIIALREVSSGIVLGVRNTSVGFTLLWAFRSGERLTPRQWKGLALLMVSVALMGAASR